DAFLALLHVSGLDLGGQGRRYPGSRRYPQFGREALAAALANAGVGDEDAVDLGGRRVPPTDSVHTARRSASFRGYADYMETQPFQTALAQLLDVARARPTAVLCAEAVPWRCHRQLIADALVASGEPVGHILSDATPEPHRLSAHARVLAPGRVRYPAVAV